MKVGRVVDEAAVRYAVGRFARDRAEGFRRLEAYYGGGAAIARRVKPFGAPNNRIAHPFARYIVTMAAGYLVGGPVGYADDGQDAALRALMRVYRAANVESIDNELAEQASLFGVGVELLYLDEGAEVRLAALEPTGAFVVYDDSAAHRPIMGIQLRSRESEDWMGWRGAERVEATVYTASEIIELAGASPGELRMIGEARAHYFGGVPMVEYWNNARERGDVEPIIPLIDAYDALQSDRVNDKQQFADSLLVFTGLNGFLESDDPNDKRSLGRRMREDQTLSLPDRDARVEWLTKQLNEADAQVLADSIRQDLHRLAMVPDMSDAQFAGNVSGVAMRYKLMGLEQLTRTKERWFREALRTRLRLVARIMNMKGEASLDADAVQIVFNRSLPTNLAEQAAALNSLRGLVPDELLLSQLPFVDDPKLAIRTRDMEQ